MGEKFRMERDDLVSFCVVSSVSSAVLSACYRRATRVNIGAHWPQPLGAFTDTCAH